MLDDRQSAKTFSSIKTKTNEEQQFEMSSAASKSTHNKRACGKTCLRCWHNRLKHTNKEAKKFLQKQKEANAIESMHAIGNFDVVGERKQSLSRWQKYQARVASEGGEENASKEGKKEEKVD